MSAFGAVNCVFMKGAGYLPPLLCYVMHALRPWERQ